MEFPKFNLKNYYGIVGLTKDVHCYPTIVFNAEFFDHIFYRGHFAGRSGSGTERMITAIPPHKKVIDYDYHELKSRDLEEKFGDTGDEAVN